MYDIFLATTRLYPFTAYITNTNIDLDNIEEIYNFQNRYKLTKTIMIYGDINGKVDFSTPELWDISCMVPACNSISEKIINNPDTNI